MATQVNARARDFHFTLDLDDSCNCCRRRHRVHDDLHVYIHSDGRAEPFTPKKAHSPSIALARCVTNLSEVIGALAELEGEDPKTVRQEFTAQTGIDLNPKRAQEISLGDLRAINAAVKRIFTKET
jgi:hypothetical protein